MCRNHPDSNRRDPFICENAIKKQASLDFASFFIAFSLVPKDEITFLFYSLEFCFFCSSKRKKRINF
jgi:hypothetical protein